MNSEQQNAIVNDRFHVIGSYKILISKTLKLKKNRRSQYIKYRVD